MKNKMNGKGSIGHTLIIGAGPAGLTCAKTLSTKGIPVTLIEASSSVGGMCKTIEMWGQKVDLGPHRFFSKDPQVLQFWKQSTRNNFQKVQRNTRILYRNNFFQYPLEPTNALLTLGPWEATRCAASYLTRNPQPQSQNFEAWVSSRFGKRLFEIFFKTYSEKLWGIPCQDIHSDFAAQRIKKLSLGETLKEAFLKKETNHNSLLKSFDYPDGGTGQVYLNMAKDIQQSGGRILTNSPIQSFILQDKHIIGAKTKGETLFFDHVVSSMPITKLTATLDPTNSLLQHRNALKFRNTILVFLRTKKIIEDFPDNWVYIHCPNLLTGRITNFSNWGPTLNPNNIPETILCLEFWTNPDSKEWNLPDSQWETRAKNEIVMTRLPHGTILDATTIRVPNCYPVYHKNYKNHLVPIINHLKGFSNLQAIGRYGAFKYNNQDHSILMGILAAENLLTNNSRDTWDINTDYEIYQEN